MGVVPHCRIQSTWQGVSVLAGAGWQVKNPTTGAVYILLEARLSELPGALPKPVGKKKKGKADAPEQPPFEVQFVVSSLADLLPAAVWTAS